MLFEKEMVGWFFVNFRLNSCRNAIRIPSERIRKDNSCRQCRIPLQLNCRMAAWESLFEGRKNKEKLWEGGMPPYEWCERKAEFGRGSMIKWEINKKRK